MLRAEPSALLGRLSVATGSVGTFVLAALVPKCPLCVAAALSAWGVSATAASAVAPGVRPVAFALAGLAAASLIGVGARFHGGKARRAPAASCCAARH